MRVTCLKENLGKSVTIVNRLVSTKTQLPVLSHILLAAEKNQLKLSATNLETGINFWVGAKVEKEGSLTIPARIFSELISSLPAGQVDLEATENLLKIICGSYKTTLNGLSAKEFPSFPSLPSKPNFSFPLGVFQGAISQVAFAAAQDEGRPVLTGVRLGSDGEKLSFVATDGYRLSVKKTSLKSDSLGKDLIIPARALLEVAHIIQETGRKEGKEKEGEEEVKMFILEGENQVCFSLGEVEIAARLIEGNFPDFAKIIPQGSTSQIRLERETLLSAVKVTSLFARDSANIVKWKVEKDKLTLSANSPQVGENTSEVEAKVEGEGGEIAFNFRFLLDFLNALKSEEIIFEMSGPLNPGVFKVVGDDSYLHIIMPVRVQG